MRRRGRRRRYCLARFGRPHTKWVRAWRDALQLQQAMHKVLAGEPRARVDYAEIVDAKTFEPVVRVGGRSYAVVAIFIGEDTVDR